MCFFALATASQLDGCYHVFVDAGANIGIHTRFLFEPSKFPRSSFRKVFDKYFGADRDPLTTCAVAFEPNPMHRAHHLRQQALYERRGWRYVPIASAVGARGKPHVLREHSSRGAVSRLHI